MSNNDFLDTLTAQNAEQKCDVDRVIALARKLDEDKERLANKYAFAVVLGLTTCAVAKAVVAQAKEWEFRAESAKEVIKTLVERFNIPDETYCEVVMDVLERRLAAEEETAPDFVD